MPLAAMIPLNIGRGRFALHEFVLGDDGGLGAPLVCTVHFDVPLCETIDHLLQSGFVTPSAFPVQQLASVPIQRFPDPELLAFLLEIMPHLIQFQDDCSPRRHWLLVVVFS